MRLKLSPDVQALNPGAGTSIAAPREARADIPRAGADDRVGMTPLLIAGWSYDYYGATGEHRFHQLGGAKLDTGRHPTLKAACDRAKQLRKEHGV